MSKELEKMKKMVAGKMGGGRKSHGLSCPHCHGRLMSKGMAQDYFRARVDKKKLPYNTQRLPPVIKKNSRYAGLSIKQFEKKYL